MQLQFNHQNKNRYFYRVSFHISNSYKTLYVEYLKSRIHYFDKFVHVFKVKIL